MKHLQADFILGAARQDQFPKIKLPEIAFTGRSNVGKSSLLNSIVLKKNLAKVSSTPGKTQQINFFNVESKWLVADMPGFGFASVNKGKRDEWVKLNFQYLEIRENLILVCVLIDARHDPMDIDLATIEWLENHKKAYMIILTKIDKIREKEVVERKKQFEELVTDCVFCREVIGYSSVTNVGRNELLAIIKKYTS